VHCTELRAGCASFYRVRSAKKSAKRAASSSAVCCTSYKLQAPQGPFPQIGVYTGRGGPATRRGCDTSLKNSKSAITLLQVVLDSAPTAKNRVFASKHAQRRHPPQ
jgi:hypothetical protein